MFLVAPWNEICLLLERFTTFLVAPWTEIYLLLETFTTFLVATWNETCGFVDLRSSDVVPPLQVFALLWRALRVERDSFSWIIFFCQDG